MRSSSSLLAILILLTSGADCQEDTEASLEALLHQYSSLPGLQPRPRPRQSQAGVKEEFGTTLSGMMGALAEIQRKGDSMLAGIRRQRQVLHDLEARAKEAERRRQEQEAVMERLAVERRELEERLGELGQEVDEIVRARSSLQPLLTEVSSHRASVRDYRAQIAAKKSELETFSRQVEEVREDLSDLETKAVKLPADTDPAILALLACSIMVNIFAGSHLVTGIQTIQRDDTSAASSPALLSVLGPQSHNQHSPPAPGSTSGGDSPGRGKFADKSNKLVGRPRRPPGPLAGPLGGRAPAGDFLKIPEQRFQDKFTPELYYDLPRSL